MATRLQLSGRTALITGGGGGIGAAVAAKLAERGTNIVITDLSQDRLDRAAVSLPRTSVLAVAADVTDATAMQQVVDAAVERFEHLDIVFANAGVGPDSPSTLRTMDPEVFERVVEVDLLGVWRTIRPPSSTSSTTRATSSSPPRLPPSITARSTHPTPHPRRAWNARPRTEKRAAPARRDRGSPVSRLGRHRHRPPGVRWRPSSHRTAAVRLQGPPRKTGQRRSPGGGGRARHRAPSRPDHLPPPVGAVLGATRDHQPDDRCGA